MVLDQRKSALTFDLKNSIGLEEHSITHPSINQFTISRFRANTARMGEELGPAAAYSAQVTLNSNDDCSFLSQNIGGCMVEPGIPRPDDPDWISKLSCISGQLGQAGTPGATEGNSSF